jgi:hypothetical protein
MAIKVVLCILGQRVPAISTGCDGAIWFLHGGMETCMGLGTVAKPTDGQENVAFGLLAIALLTGPLGAQPLCFLCALALSCEYHEFLTVVFLNKSLYTIGKTMPIFTL